MISMCKWGTHVTMPLQVWVNHPNIPMEFEMKERDIDACIAPIIYKLNKNGVVTLNCCCGHRQDRRYNAGHIEDKNWRSEVLITNESIRHADSLGCDFRQINSNASVVLID